MRSTERVTPGNVRLRAVLLIMLIMTLMMATSCGSVSQKFKPTTVANVSVFADQTIAMLSESDFGFAGDRAIYLRDFFNPENEKAKAFLAHRNEAEMFFRRIINYSLTLVLITETKSGAAAQVEAYGDFVSEMNTDLLKKIGVKPDYYAEILENVRTAKDFLGALRAAQPIINSAGRYMNQVLDRLVVSADELVRGMESQIDTRYHDIIRYQKALEKEKFNILIAMEYLFQTLNGDAAAYQKLINSSAIFKKSVIPQGAPAEKDYEAIFNHLVQRLDTLDRIGKEIEPEWKIYRATHNELDDRYQRAIENTNRARLVTLVWIRAHQKMASGVSNPAEWFDIKSLPGQLFKMGTKAVF